MFSFIFSGYENRPKRKISLVFLEIRTPKLLPCKPQKWPFSQSSVYRSKANSMLVFGWFWRRIIDIPFNSSTCQFKYSALSFVHAVWFRSENWTPWKLRTKMIDFTALKSENFRLLIFEKIQITAVVAFGCFSDLEKNKIIRCLTTSYYSSSKLIENIHVYTCICNTSYVYVYMYMYYILCIYRYCFFEFCRKG